MEIAALRKKSAPKPLGGMGATSGISNFYLEENALVAGIYGAGDYFVNMREVGSAAFYRTRPAAHNSADAWHGSFKLTEDADGILVSEEYKGFEPMELLEVDVTYRKSTVFFSKLFRIMLLCKSGSNGFYPEPYLAICPELELEGIGSTREHALSDIDSLFYIYFTETEKISTDPSDHLELIKANIQKASSWKSDFCQLYRNLNKKGSIPINEHKCLVLAEA